ncbi:hypothetical protein MSAN_01488100 [Mycena sanguinolenta]|uniref:Uncharacterized protein n=1 Tax=Mycena sanguinolenta TaxID=230812 RepID=A0A8H6Y9I8_9AGAR|nr:hypothetical protein MSAN_01488100 [Mycena sanguinolenta]
MGRWTAEYQDTVFLSKLKGLVSGAIKRSKLEKGEPSISYKHFVEDLDAGDSFTTTVIDILVQELAERRLRSSPGDRRLIADRTAKSLRLLATPIRIYRERRNTGRRAVNLTEYLITPPEEMGMEDDDDEFETMLGRATMPSMPEGARTSTSELFDAYYSPAWTTASAVRRSLPVAGPPTPALSDDSSPPPGLPPPATGRVGNVWSLPPAAASSLSLSLSRQPSIRRPTRSRTSDFHEFTAQRRSSTRDSRTADPGAGDESWARTSRSTRRFFPFSHQSRRHDSRAGNDTQGDSAGEISDEALYLEPESTVPFYSFPTPSTSSLNDDHPPETSEQRATSVPRLRRGGVRPPESLLLRRVSPALDIAPPSPASSSEGVVEFATGAILTADAASYPTPGESGNETPVREDENQSALRLTEVIGQV